MLPHEYETQLQIGNAAYHNDLLYEELRKSIPQLSNLLLSSEEDKTKANAAGALSNLVRKYDKLCEDIVSKGAMQVFLWTLFEKPFIVFLEGNLNLCPKISLRFLTFFLSLYFWCVTIG